MIYFGNKGSMRWVKAPNVDFDASRSGWTSQMEFLNGGVAVRSSVSSHARAALAWGLMSAAEARDILRPLRSGKLVYWVDPFADNLFPEAWAEPWRGAYDGAILDNGEVRPTLLPEAEINNYPQQTAQYVLTSATTTFRKSTYIPIPPGYTLHLGATGSLVSGTARLKVTPDAGTAVNMTFKDPADMNPYTMTVNGGTGGNGVTVALTGTGTIRLRSMSAHMARTGSQPLSDGFIPGEGMGGSLPTSQPTESRYSAVLHNSNRSVSVNLIEVEPWR